MKTVDFENWEMDAIITALHLMLELVERNPDYCPPEEKEHLKELIRKMEDLRGM